MRLINQYYSVADAERDARALESQGIPTHVSSKMSNSLSRFRTGAITVGLWVLLNHQYNEAVEYLGNKKYKVKSGISKEEMKYFKEQAKKNTFDYLNEVLLYVGFVALIGLSIVAYQIMKNGVNGIV